MRSPNPPPSVNEQQVNENKTSDLPKKSDYAEILDRGIAAFEHYDAQRFANTHTQQTQRKHRSSPVTRTLLALVIANCILYSKYYFEEKNVLELEEAEAQLQSSFPDSYQKLKGYTADETEFDATTIRQQQSSRTKFTNKRKK